MTPGYETVVTAASAAAAAESRHAAATAALAAAEAEAATVRERAAGLDAKRQAIVARRAGGGALDEDGIALAVLAADADGLRDLQQQREAAVADARGPADAAAAALTTAKFQLRRAEALAAETALCAHADALVQRLQETLTQLAEVGAGIGRGRSVWHPDEAFVDVVRRLDGQRHHPW